MSAYTLIILNLLVAVTALPPASFLLRELIIEKRSPALANRLINMGMRYVFTLPIVISFLNIIFALSLALAIPLKDKHLLEMGLTVGTFSCIGTWLFFYIYKKL